VSDRATFGETELEMVQRHVREGERHLTLQQEILTWLTDRGYSTDEAERLLTNMEDLQRMHCEHLTRLQQNY
jgi:SOS response regulatory protein OraA/RecX